MAVVLVFEDMLRLICWHASQSRSMEEEQSLQDELNGADEDEEKLYFNNLLHFISIHFKIHDTVGH